MATRESIMAFLRRHDERARDVMLYAGRGYFYFGSATPGTVSIADRFKDTSVMVNRLNALSQEDWLAEFKSRADAVSETVSRIDAVIARLEERVGQWFFHTTSFSSLDDILRAGHLKPKDSSAFISFSENPHFGDISGGDVVLVFERKPLLPYLLQVEYDEDWYDKYPDHAAYIAGEGWREQFSLPDYEDYPNYDPDDEFWEPDPDDDAAFERDAEIEAFTQKSGEREWITNTVRCIPLTALRRVSVANPSNMIRAREIASETGYTGPIVPMATARREYAKI